MIFVNKNHVWKISISLLIATIFLSLVHQTASACSPIPPTPWFTESLSFVETDLPQTVTFSVGENKNLIFENTTGLSFDLGLNGQSREIGNKISFRINSADGVNVVWVNNVPLRGVEYRNRIEDNRPADVTPPAAQDILIPVTLDAQAYTIKLRIRYEINDQYVPNSVEISKNSCSGYYVYSFLLSWCPKIIAGGVIFLTVIAVLRARRLNASSKPNDGIRK